MNIMWRRNSPTPRNYSLRDGAATYPRPTHKKGWTKPLRGIGAPAREIAVHPDVNPLVD